MQREEFKNWLINEYKEGQGIDEGSAENRVSNAQKVENAFGDLDTHYDKDKLENVLELIQYSKQDEAEQKALPKGLEIDGNWYNGLATLRQAVNRYFEFKTSNK